MKFLRGMLDSVEPMFKPGGKLERLYPLYEAGDTFLYTPGEVAHDVTHVRDGIDLKRMMTFVVVALTPCIAFGLWNTGYQANKALADNAAAMQAGIEKAKQTRVADAGEALAAAQAAQAAGEEGAAALVAEAEAAVAAAEAYETTQIVYDGDEAPYAVASIDNGDWHLWLMSMSGLGFSPSNPISCIVHGALWFLPLYIVTLAAGGTAEAAFAIVRKHEINEGFLVTSMLYPLTLPPTCPLWIAALGILFGVVLAKEVFGGTGKNFLNIALTSRAFLYFAYPGEMIGDKVWNAGTAALRQPDGSFADGYSAATMLTWMGTADGGTTMAQAEAASGATFFAATLGNIEGAIGSTSALACLIGAGILIATGVGSWRIIAGCVVGMVAFATPLWLIGSETNAVFAIPPWTHLVIGGFAFGAVFMATDPVSASMTNTGRWVYGILIGLMTALIRVVNPAFPEGIGLAVLFGNVFAPLIDYFVVEANIARRKAYLTKGSAQTA